MLHRFFVFIMLVVLASSLPAAAGELRQGPRAVVELFTSQGCSSCPKADAMLAELGERGDIVALAYHVDYWDYVGWEDTFGERAFSDRQRDYAQSWGSSRIFTPQLIVNGAGGVVASKQEAVDAALARAALPVLVGLSCDDDDKLMTITISGGDDQMEGVVWLVTFIDRAEVDIERGENKGRKIAYTQIVTGRQVVGMFRPGSEGQIRLPLDEVLTGKANGVAILVQQEREGLPGPILGAASYTR
ncbi:DUF1223 domain-containing protein [Devosia sp.]|uniref:DUF1223 domain-containing protein n=1 Tax=Devosia sp. TaxID=1871048 RepID=UPI0035B35670